MDQLGAQLLKGLTPVLLGKAAPFILNHCHVTVQQFAGANLAEDARKEIKWMLQDGTPLPDCVIVHVGDAYLGNENFNLNDIEVELEAMFMVVINKIEEQVQKRACSKKVKTIWSRALAHPNIGRGKFSFRSTFEGLKKINSEVVVTLNGLGIGIIKHGEIDPKSSLFFDQDKNITEVAKRQFIRNINDCLGTTVCAFTSQISAQRASTSGASPS